MNLDFSEPWWIKDPSPRPNQDCPKTMCFCMRQPDGYTDRPDSNCFHCGGNGYRAGIKIEVTTGTSVTEGAVTMDKIFAVDLAGPANTSGTSGAEAQQIFINQSRI